MTFSEWFGTAGESTLPGRSAVWGGADERVLDLDEAWRRVHTDLRALGWTSSARFTRDLGPAAAQCILRDEAGVEVAEGVGAGKGSPDVALVGAHFEALEHAVAGPSWAERLPLVVAPGHAISAAWGEESWAQDLPPDTMLAAMPVRALGDGPDFVVPLSRCAPWYLQDGPSTEAVRAATGDRLDTSPLAAYATNSGCAIGASTDEALLHGLNELIERDSVSLFLLLTVLGGHPPPPVLAVTPGDLELSAVLEAGEAAVGAPITLLDLTTDLGIPSVLAVAGTDTDEPHYGAGASTSLRIAVERALTEIVQTARLREAVRRPLADGEAAVRGIGPGPSYRALAAEQHGRAASIRQRFARHPGLLRCATMSVSDHLSGPRRQIPPGPGRPAPLRTQIDSLVGALRSVGHAVGWTGLHRWETGTTVAHVHVPGLEVFQHVLVGHAPRPGPRAERLAGRRPRSPHS